MNIADIVIGERHRREMGDVTGLADSIKTQGLLQPIGVTPENALVFGYRRLCACRDTLGWNEIDVRVVNVTSIVAGEYAENEIRKDFTPSERVAIKRSIEKEIGNRQGQRTDQLRKNISEVVKPGERTEDASSRLAGFGNRITASQAETVVDNGSPELVEAMDRGDIKISAAAVIAAKPPDEQRKIVAMPRKERKAVVRASRPAKSDKPVSARKQQAMPKTDSVRLAIRPLVEAGETVNRQTWAEQLSVSEATIQRAELQELARLEGLDEAAALEARQRKRIDPPVRVLKLPTSEEIGEPPPGASWEERAAWRDSVGAKVVLHAPRMKQLLQDEVLVNLAAHIMRRSRELPSAEVLAASLTRMLDHAVGSDAEPGGQRDFAKIAREARQAVVNNLDAAIATLTAYREVVVNTPPAATTLSDPPLAETQRQDYGGQPLGGARLS